LLKALKLELKIIIELNLLWIFGTVQLKIHKYNLENEN